MYDEVAVAGMSRYLQRVTFSLALGPLCRCRQRYLQSQVGGKQGREHALSCTYVVCVRRSMRVCVGGC